MAVDSLGNTTGFQNYHRRHFRVRSMRAHSVENTREVGGAQSTVPPQLTAAIVPNDLHRLFSYQSRDLQVYACSTSVEQDSRDSISFRIRLPQKGNFSALGTSLACKLSFTRKTMNDV